jgi:uncharacterized protein
MEENTPPQLPEINPVVKALSHIIILMGLYFMFTILFATVGIYIAALLTGVTIKPFSDDMLAALADANNVNAYKIYFLVSSLGSFAGTALVFAKFFARANIKEYFGLKGAFPPIKLLMWVVIIAIGSLPLISYLGTISKSIPLPANVVEEANKIQETYAAIYNTFLNTDNLWAMLFNLLVIAVTPAIGEELLFRGAFMQIFYRLFGNRINIAVFVVAFLFSAMHMQAYNFLAMLLIGAIFGYLYYWSGNIMVSIWAHFLNNALVVVFCYLYTLNPGLEIFAIDYEFGPVSAIISAFVLAGALYGFYRDTRPYHATTIE